MNKKQITIPCTGYSVAADIYENERQDSVVLVFVGYGSSKERNAALVADIAAQTQSTTVVVDYSGHGESPFELDETRPAQHLIETVCAYDWVRASYPVAKITVIGTSYGGFMAAYLTRFRNFDKLVLRTPAIYKPADFYSAHAEIDKIAVRTYRSDPSAVAKHPLFLQSSVFEGTTLLVIHGQDESVPIETSTQYKNAFSAEVFVAEAFRHSMRDAANPQDQIAGYQETVASWIKK